jgi:hypothetical protein
MPSKQLASTTTAPTQFIKAGTERYAYRRFGSTSDRQEDHRWPPNA